MNTFNIFIEKILVPSIRHNINSYNTLNLKHRCLHLH